jgi:hypothetical protein
VENLLAIGGGLILLFAPDLFWKIVTFDSQMERGCAWYLTMRLFGLIVIINHLIEISNPVNA